MRPGLAAMQASRRTAAASASAVASATSISVRSFPAMSGQLAPAAAVAGEQIVRFFRSFAAGVVNLQSPRAGLVPGIEEGLHRAPAGFHAVGALEQDVVADHAVVDQRLVAGRRLRLEVVLVAELHLDAVDIDRWPRHLGVELQLDAL